MPLSRVSGPPLERAPVRSSPYRMRFGRRSSGILTICPAQRSFFRSIDARHTFLLEDFSTWDFVLPLHSEQFAEAVEVKSVEFLGVPLVYCPGLACL